MDRADDAYGPPPDDYGATAPETPDAPRAAPEDWLLQFTSSNPRAAEGDGRPWGDGTAMAQRAYAGVPPWDGGCAVTPMIGGFLTMNAIREAFEAAIVEAQRQAARGVPPGQRGHVYIADWQFNALRDLSIAQPWGGNPWDPRATVARDQTALGFVLRMMSEGIVVKLLLWMPTTLQRTTLKNLADEHWSVAAAVQDHDATLRGLWKQPESQFGVVALDLRTAAPVAAALHQKMIAVRVGGVNVAYVGGVDLAFTRRDFGLLGTNPIGIGDWQSGRTTPISAPGWPKQSPPPLGGYPAFPYTEDGQFPEDLPESVYGAGYRHWHDHHLQLRGPAVMQVEQQFAERWIMETGGRVYFFEREAWEIGADDQVQLTSKAAIGPGPTVRPLPAAAPVEREGYATVQIWRTIPLRPNVNSSPFKRGEFTVMAGVAKAVSRATQLITIWDQYFWSVPLAKLLAARLMTVPTLRLLIVLPPYGTTLPGDELALRLAALQALWGGLSESARQRVLVRDMWASGPNVGVYVHAKCQSYDEMLLVCGSANMNRRSTQCDAELDCAVLDVPTVRTHMANLAACITGAAWQDFSGGWLWRWWEAMRTRGARALIPDPFFAASIGAPRTPNGVPMPYTRSWRPYEAFEPSSIATAVETNVCQYPECRDDPKATGRLDEISYLLERCHSGTTWPWRVAETTLSAEELSPEPMPRLTL
jgi:phosphatidylserine/phosphatidylglycerophosphate/cardiolipin synthase-like enzyme